MCINLVHNCFYYVMVSHNFTVKLRSFTSLRNQQTLVKPSNNLIFSLESLYACYNYIKFSQNDPNAIILLRTNNAKRDFYQL